MSEKDLERLKDLPVPPPRPDAKAAAIAAARAAFAVGRIDEGDPTQALHNDRDGVSDLAGSIRPTAARAYSSETTQGVASGLRHTHASTNRRFRMRASHTMAIAASVAALVVAAPVAMNYWSSPSRQAPTAQEIAALIAEREAQLAIQRVIKESVDWKSADKAKLASPVAVAAPPAEPSDAGILRKQEADQRALVATERDAMAALQQRNLVEAARQRSLSDRLEGRSSLGATGQAPGPVLATAPPPAPLVAARPGYVGGQIATVAPLPRTEPYLQPQVEQGRDRFEAKESNPVKSVAAEPVSTFSIDVDTASYSFVRRSLNAGRLPPKDAVRVEEMVNYFPYDYARPESAAEPFRATVQVFPSPWNARNQLVHIGLKGYDLKSAERPRANLVLLVDVSGSMGPADRLPLVKNAFRLLLDNLKPDDTLAIVTYASGSDIRLEPTKVAEKAKILAAIDSLRAGGSTHGAQGITDAYKVAEAHFDKAAVNRVILATDGDWNVGITNRDELKGFIERKRETGIFLSILGVGMGNHNDALMQTLAQSGNGAAAYIDTLNEARKVLVEEASSTLFPIAKDVKIQLELNPARVSEYRLIGYETRMLRREDFNNDKVDAGDVGSGHAVTAIYEITPVGAPMLADDLRYQPRRADAKLPAMSSLDSEIGFLKLRYKLPKEEASRLSTFVIGPEQTRRTIAEASAEARFSVAVAAFGQLLRGLPYMQGYTWDDVIALANGARGEDPFGYRAELVNLVRLAKSASASVAPR
jgi:Ca-activated chloride channel family protein